MYKTDTKMPFEKQKQNKNKTKNKTKQKQQNKTKQTNKNHMILYEYDRVDVVSSIHKPLDTVLGSIIQVYNTLSSKKKKKKKKRR